MKKLIRFPRARSRSGVHLLLASLSLALVAACLGLLAAQRQAVSSDWVRLLERDLFHDDLLESALEEALSICLEEVNLPGSSLYEALRDGDLRPVRFLLDPPHQGEVLQVEVRFQDRASLVGEDPWEWGGRLVLQARWENHEAGRSYQVRGVGVTLPAPFDEACVHDWRQPQPGFPEGEHALELEDLRRLASMRLRAAPGGTIQQAFDDLVGGLEALSGMVLVENSPDDPLVLRDWRHRGRTLLVTLGPLELVDVRLDDPSRDQLSVLALGDIELGGEIEASVGLSQVDLDDAPLRILLPGLEITGSLVLTAGDYQAPRETHLRCQAAAPLGPTPEGLHVGISPDPEERWSR